MTELTYSDFDSSALGIPTYLAADTSTGDLERHLGELRSAEGLVVLAKLGAEKGSRIAILEEFGFRRICTQICLTRTIGASQDDAQALQIKNVLRMSSQQLTAHAEAFSYSRFYQDSHLPRQSSQRLMLRWLQNSLAGRKKIAALNNDFCTFEICDGRVVIDLLSCLEVRKGHATRLLESVASYGVKQGAGVIEVTTEAENMPALQTYLKCGFTPIRSFVCLHLVEPAKNASS